MNVLQTQYGFFIGEYECKLDSKGRLVLPSKVKANLPEVSTNALVIRKGFDPSLILYPMIEYKKIHQKINSLNDFNPQQLKLKRLFFRSVAQVELDNVNRILIPRIMLNHSKIEKRAMIVGMGSYLEIWDPDIHNEHLADNSEEYPELTQKFLDEV